MSIVSLVNAGKAMKINASQRWKFPLLAKVKVEGPTIVDSLVKAITVENIEVARVEEFKFYQMFAVGEDGKYHSEVVDPAEIPKKADTNYLGEEGIKVVRDITLNCSMHFSRGRGHVQAIRYNFETDMGYALLTPVKADMLCTDTIECKLQRLNDKLREYYDFDVESRELGEHYFAGK